MKVARNTPDQLILDDVPWLIGLLLAGFVLIFVGIGLSLVFNGELFGLMFAGIGGGLGLGAIAVFVQRVQIILDRRADTLTIRRRSLFGYSAVTHTLADLTGAVLETTTGSKGGTLYRPTLVLTGMSAGRHPVVESYTNTSGPARAVDAINTWLADSGTGIDTSVDSGAPTA